MKIVPFEELGNHFLMLTYFEGLRIRTNKKINNIGDRKYNTFIYVYSGYAILEDEQKRRIIIKPGNLVYIPMGSTYISKECDEAYSFFFLDFNMVEKESGSEIAFTNEITMLSENTPKVLTDYIEQFAKFRPKKTRGTILRAQHIFFSMLYYIADMMSESIVKKGSSVKVRKAIEYIHYHYNENTSSEQIAKLCQMSQSRFRESFRAQTGQTFVEYRNIKRLEAAKVILGQDKGVSIHKVASQVGFEDPKYFAKVFKKYLGITPKEYIKKIRY